MIRRVVVAAAAAATLWAAPAAGAATVTSQGDSGAGTLRAVVAGAAPGEVVSFAPGLGPVTLSSAVEVDKPVLIQDDGDAEVNGSSPLLRFVAGSAGSSVRGVRLVRPGATAVEVASGVGPVSVRAAPAIVGTPALALAAGANGGLGPPADLRVFRGRTGALVIAGTAPVAGTIDVYRGNPGAGSGAAFLAEAAVPAGPFGTALSLDAPPAEGFTAALTGDPGTSAFAAVRVPGDLTPPRLLGAVAVSQTQVRVQLSEPLDPRSVGPGDFSLSMGGVPRALAAAAPGPDGATAMLSAPRAWRGGEAGFVTLSEPGALADATGNESATTDAVRVAAAPADVLEPLASSLRVRPRVVCLTRGRRCRRPGAVVRFVASEESRATFVLQRGNRRVGVRKYDARVGANAVRFDGRVRGRKLRRGTYRLLVYLADAVGNETQDPPLQRFRVRRTTG